MPIDLPPSMHFEMIPAPPQFLTMGAANRTLAIVAPDGVVRIVAARDGTAKPLPDDAH